MLDSLGATAVSSADYCCLCANASRFSCWGCKYGLCLHAKAQSRFTHSARPHLLSLLMQTYKEICEDISYDCNIDVITATCSNNSDRGGYYETSSLTDASKCKGDISTSLNVLACSLTPSLRPSPQEAAAAAPTVCPTYAFVSEVDQTGRNAPDGVSHYSAAVAHVLKPIKPCPPSPHLL